MSQDQPGPTWPAPLPDFSRPAINTRLKVGSYTFGLLVSDVMTDPNGAPDTDLVQLTVTLDGRPLTLHDLGATTAAACGALVAAVQPPHRADRRLLRSEAPTRPRAEPASRVLGRAARTCLNRRLEDDCSLAVVAGISTWRVGSRPRGPSADYVRELAETLAEVLAFWVLTVERDRRAAPGTP